MPSTRRWNTLCAQAARIVQTILDEIESYRDDRSADWQESESAEALEDTAENLREVFSLLQNLG